MRVGLVTISIKAGTAWEGILLKEVVLLFLKLGFVAFGGPAAHIAMFEEEVVTKRKWMTRDHFLDLVGATNLIPGPNSTEMVIHCGFHRAGWPGLILGGISFILPATLLTGLLAWFYATYQTVPQFEALVYGVKPAVIVVILGAVYKLGRKALKNRQLGVIGAFVIFLSLLGVSEIVAIFAGGLVGMGWLYVGRTKAPSLTPLLPWLPLQRLTDPVAPFIVPLGQTAPGAATAAVADLFLVFLKIGAVLFGSGYVLVAYLEGELVNRLGWLSQGVLLDGIAMGQFTPGPVLSTSTFIGYQIGGVGGAMAATLGIFLPSFIFVAILNPIVPKLRKSNLASAFLDAVNVSALGLMVAVVIKLGWVMLVNWQAWLIVLFSIGLFFGLKKEAAWVVVGGAVLGYLLLALGPI